MNNLEVQRLLDDCRDELAVVKGLVDGLGVASTVAPFLTKYAIIKSCGTIEQSFKAIIADYCSRRSKRQLKRYLDRKVRESSSNPSYSAICSLLNDFDEHWNKGFKAAIAAHAEKAKLQTSLQSLVDARNEFAHGGNPSASISDVLQYFAYSRTVIEQLDSIVA